MFVDVGDVAVHVVDVGVGPPTVVGLAGSFGTSEIWQSAFALLQPGTRTVALDHLGTGLTEVLPERVTFEGQVGLVGALLDVLGVERCLLVGDSALAAVAVEAAVRWPDRVAGLGIVAGSVGGPPHPGTEAFVAGLRADPERTVGAFAAACLPEDERGELRRWLAAIIHRTGADRAAHLVESFAGVDVRDRLGSVAVPALVLHGELDVVTPAAHAAETAAALPDAELRVLPGIGHVPMLSRPDDVARAITDTLARVAAAG